MHLGYRPSHIQNKSIFTKSENSRQTEAATKIIKHNLETTEMAQRQYDLSGLTYFPFNTIDNNPTQVTEELPIYWDAKYHKADIKNEE